MHGELHPCGFQLAELRIRAGRTRGRTEGVAARHVRDEIAVAEGSRSMGFIQENMEAQKRRRVSPWVEMDADNFKGTFARLPAREDLALPINENFIIEYYSR